jgi:hypothetical protein
MVKMSIGTGIDASAKVARRPVVVRLPVLSGTGRIGSPVAVDPGEWSGKPAPRVTLRWQRDGADIAGATAAVYVPTAADDRTTLRCLVTATGSTDAASEASAGLAVAYAPPVASGALPDVTYTLNSGTRTVDAAADFAVAGDPTLAGVTWSVTGTATISSSGVLSIDTTAPRSNSLVTVTAANSGGAAQTSFDVTVGLPPFAIARTGTDLSFNRHAVVIRDGTDISWY